MKTETNSGMKTNETLTSYIKHLAVSGLLSISARIKSVCNLTGVCFEMPNISYMWPLGIIKQPKWQKINQDLQVNAQVDWSTRSEWCLGKKICETITICPKIKLLDMPIGKD